MHTCVSVRMYAMKRQKEKNAIKKHRDKGEKCKEETSAGKAKTTNCQRLLSDDALTNQSEPARLPGCCFSPGCQYRPTLWLQTTETAKPLVVLWVSPLFASSTVCSRFCRAAIRTSMGTLTAWRPHKTTQSVRLKIQEQAMWPNNCPQDFRWLK